MQIGELAKRTSVSVSALRYYEQMGLLPTSERAISGYRLFSEESVERVQFIRRAKALGFSLKEIRSVLALYDEGISPCELASRLAHRKLVKIERLIEKLQARKLALRNALVTWQTTGHEGSPFCGILDASISINYRRSDSMARTIEVFTAGCPLCDETLQRVKEAVAPCGCQVIERAPDSMEAQQYEITAVPVIVVNGQVVFTGRPTPDQAIALLRLP